MSISASDLVNKYVGQSEQMVKALFKVARDNAPCVIFVDEADSVLGARGKGGASDGATAGMERLLNQFLVEMQGVSNGDSNRRVVVIAGTNRPWALDGAVVRRLPKAIYISLPEYEARLQIIQMNSEGRLSDEICETLARSTEGYSGSDLANLVNEIFMEQPRRVMNAKAFKVRPVVSSLSLSLFRAHQISLKRAQEGETTKGSLSFMCPANQMNQTLFSVRFEAFQ